jgi:serine/threonine protein kinase
MVGQKVGKYNVVSRLGRGGMGTVYKAVDETLGREVAIKCLNADLSDSELLKRFRAEAVALARLNHPNIATIFDLTEHDGQLLMVMEFVRGETFEKVSSRLGPMPLDRAVSLCTQVLDALAHAHREGIVHRDLKPANLMLAHSGLAKVMDFGLARMAGTEHLTNDGYMVGTPAYMSPEQVLARDIDGRADLYAMGVVLFRMLTGQLPFKADSGIAMAQKQMYDQPTPVRQLRTELPSTAEDIITRALAKKPEERFQTADEFKAALSMLSGFTSTEATRTLTSPVPRAPIRPRTDLPTMPPTLTPHLMAKPGVPGSVASASAPAPAPAPAPAAATTRARRLRLAALAAAAVLLLAAVPAAIIISRGRAPSGDATSGTAPSAAPSADSVAKPSDAPPAPAPVPEPASASAAAPAAAAVPEVSPARGSTAPAVPAPRVAKTDPKRPRASPVAETPPATPTPTPPPAPPTSAVVPTVAFTKLKLLVIDDGKARDRDASLRLGADTFLVMDGDTTISTTQYRDVIGLFHSHSREPKWVTPNGTGVPIAKVGGKFSFLKDTPDWVTVRTKEQFIPLRVPGRDLARVVAELEARTGIKVIRPR